MKRILFLFISLLFFKIASAQNFSDLALTPPMGWNSWNYFATKINEQVITEMADAMVKSGMKDAGYQYIVIDDSWQLGKVDKNKQTTVNGRDNNGELIADPNKFPNGIKAVADYVHSKGLKFGLYTSPGLRTCTGCNGSMGYEETDIKTFAGWGVDFIKLDWCGCRGNKEEVLKIWRTALDKIERSIVLSVNAGNDYTITRRYANMWRTTSDIMDVWDYPLNTPHRFYSICDVIENQAGLEFYQEPGLWNDPDMLQVGNGQLSEDENRAHFSIWAMLSAPLIAGNDLRNMKEEVRDILNNTEVIAINNDPLGHQGHVISESNDSLQIWFKSLIHPQTCAIALLNRSTKTVHTELEFSDLGLKGTVSIRDLWKHKDLGPFTNAFSAEVPPHGVVMLKFFTSEEPAPTVKLSDISEEGNIYEAETGHRIMKLFTIENEFKGYTGSGYILGHSLATDARLKWFIPVAKAGLYRIGIRYSLGNTQPIPAVVRFNETDVRAVTCYPTGSWDNWETIFFETNLDSRVNHLCFYAGDNELNIIALDHLLVIPVK